MGDATRPGGTVYQLRIYEVAAERRDAFHRRFRDQALRIMERYGFRMVALWETRSVANFEFVCLLAWPDAETMERQWKAFLADAEWIGIKKKMAADTGEPVLRVTSRVLDALEYGPALRLA